MFKMLIRRQIISCSQKFDSLKHFDNKSLTERKYFFIKNTILRCHYEALKMPFPLS